MSRLGIQDYRDILDIIETANSLNNVDSFRGELINSLSRMFQAESAMFILSNPEYTEVDGSDCVSINIDKEIWKEFPLHREIDPFYQYGGFRRSVISINDLMPYKIWEKTSFYNEFCRPLGIYHKLVIHLRRYHEFYGVICICRPKDRPDFSDKQKIACQLLATPLSTALAYATTISRFSQNQEGTNNQGFSPPTGSLLFDYNFNIVDIDRKAEEYCRLLSQNRPDIRIIKNTGVYIPDEVIDLCLNFRELLTTRNRNSPQKLQKIIAIKNGRYILIETYAVWKSSNSVSVPYFLVTLVDLPGPRFSNEEWNAFDLTRREIEIAKCVCQGLSNRDISDLLYISENTVETHLKNLFRKTGIKNRTSLYSLMESHRD
jgi:DNA-binding CsgD family transcriptional regulator